MIYISWNSQGIGADLTVRHLKASVRKYNPDMVFLMETKNKNGKMENIRRKLNFNKVVYVEPQGIEGGLDLWCKKTEIKILQFFIDTRILNK